MKTAQNGKGDKPRPTDKAGYDAGYDRIFGEKKVKAVKK